MPPPTHPNHRPTGSKRPPHDVVAATRKAGHPPTGILALAVVGIGVVTTPAVATSTGFGLIVTLWLVALGALLLGILIGPLLAAPAPALVLLPARPHVADDFFGVAVGP